MLIIVKVAQHDQRKNLKKTQYQVPFVQGGHYFFIKNPSTFQYIMFTPKSDNQYISVYFTQENQNVPQLVYVDLRLF